MLYAAFTSNYITFDATLKTILRMHTYNCSIETALNEALTAEVRRLKLATQEITSDSDPSKGMVTQQQLPINSPMFQLHQQQSSQLNMHQLQQQHQKSHSQVNFHQLQSQQPPQQPQSQPPPPQQNGSTSTKPESNQ